MNSETCGLDFASTVSLGQRSSISGKWERKGRKKTGQRKLKQSSDSVVFEDKPCALLQSSQLGEEKSTANVLVTFPCSCHSFRVPTHFPMRESHFPQKIIFPFGNLEKNLSAT